MISALQKLQAIVVVWLIQAVLAKAQANPPCQDTCGNVQIRFPFGIGEGCFWNKGFEVFCNDSFSTPKPFLTSINMELLEIYYNDVQVRVNNPVISSNCGQKAPNLTGISLAASPFFFSSTNNRFTAMGCNNYAMLVRGGDTVGGCLSICADAAYNSSGCYGINCCQASIPPFIQAFESNMTNPLSNTHDQIGCKSSFIVDQNWFQSLSSSSSLQDLEFLENVPAFLDWATDDGYCDLSEASNFSCTLDGRYCWQETNISQLCVCRECQDFKRCTDPSNYLDCQLYCLSKPGGFCLCPRGYISNGYRCYPYHAIYGNSRPKTKSIIIGVGSGFGFLFLLVGMWLTYKITKRRRAEKLKQKFFKRNGGLLLQQQLSSTDNHVEKTKLFTSKELDKATDHYHVNRILGQGGQGTVYKGMLTDGRVVAIKKSKVVDEDKLDQFINEVVILTQINHRNVVKILGCCLETEVPLLVYEFVPSGSLFQYLQEQTEEFPMTWEMRLRIATEVANALSYLHSAASIPIYHRDIKSSNILLDEKYRAKVADFGTSKSIAIDQTHVTTRVQGTFGYLDPEYFQSSQFTDKSDVYSFGVVLVELLTGQKPISSLRSVEERSLAAYFLGSMEENRLFEIVDGRVVNEGRKEEIMAVGNLAKRCLNLKGKRRPTMKTVAMELEGIRASEGGSIAMIEDHEEVDYIVDDYVVSLDVASTSISATSRSLPSGLDVQPLLYSNTKKL